MLSFSIMNCAWAHEQCESWLVTTEAVDELTIFGYNTLIEIMSALDFADIVYVHASPSTQKCLDKVDYDEFSDVG